MDEPVEALVARLRAEYLVEVPARLRELSTAVGAYSRDTPGAAEQLARLFHRLAGSAGAYGFGEVTALCRQAEAMIKPPPAGMPPGPGVEGLRAQVARITDAFAAGPTTPPIAGAEGEESEPR